MAVREPNKSSHALVMEKKKLKPGIALNLRLSSINGYLGEKFPPNWEREKLKKEIKTIKSVRFFNPNFQKKRISNGKKR